jgi:nucleotide-binding universal stress UspA family protein
VHEDDGLPDRLQSALSIARAFGAHLHLMHVTPIEAYTVSDPYGAFLSPEIVRVLEEEAGRLKARIEQQLAIEDVSWDYEEATGGLLTRLIRRASLADLVITGRRTGQGDFGPAALSVIGDMLHRSRTPILVLGDGPGRFDPLGVALVAWNASYEAANALRSAVPLLKVASKVRVVTIVEGEEDCFPPTDALEYLSRHGVHAELVEPQSTSNRIEEQLLGQARIHRASYIVMGGYSHSRAGELLFGGVTRSLLKECPVSLFVAR